MAAFYKHKKNKKWTWNFGGVQTGKKQKSKTAANRNENANTKKTQKKTANRNENANTKTNRNKKTRYVLGDARVIQASLRNLKQRPQWNSDGLWGPRGSVVVPRP